MFIFSVRTVVLAVAMSAPSLSIAATLSAQSELLCSPEGLIRLIPQFNVGNSPFLIQILTCRHSFQRTKVFQMPLI
jgi:hypothetical protein